MSLQIRPWTEEIPHMARFDVWNRSLFLSFCVGSGFDRLFRQESMSISNLCQEKNFFVESASRLTSTYRLDKDSANISRAAYVRPSYRVQPWLALTEKSSSWTVHQQSHPLLHFHLHHIPPLPSCNGHHSPLPRFPCIDFSSS